MFSDSRVLPLTSVMVFRDFLLEINCYICCGLKHCFSSEDNGKYVEMI